MPPETQSSVQKAQPWKTQWPAKLPIPAPGNQGTKHGFERGEEVIMDGNANGHSLDIVTGKPATKERQLRKAGLTGTMLL